MREGGKTEEEVRGGVEEPKTGEEGVSKHRAVSKYNFGFLVFRLFLCI